MSRIRWFGVGVGWTRLGRGVYRGKIVDPCVQNQTEVGGALLKAGRKAFGGSQPTGWWQDCVVV